MARKVGANKADIIERQQRTIELRKSGWSFRAIGARLGVTHVQSIYDFRDAIADLNQSKLESTDDYRTLELERLDMLIKGLAPMAEVGNTNAVNSYIKVVEQRAKLLGLYAPEKKDINIKDLSKLTDDELRAIAEG
jgi:hypothetical protein